MAKKSQKSRVFSHFPEEKIRQDKKIHQKKKKLVQKSSNFFFWKRGGGGGKGGRVPVFFSCLNFANFQKRKWEKLGKFRQK